jgi:hypothetical protein
MRFAWQDGQGSNVVTNAPPNELPLRRLRMNPTPLQRMQSPVCDFGFNARSAIFTARPKNRKPSIKTPSRGRTGRGGTPTLHEAGKNDSPAKRHALDSRFCKWRGPESNRRSPGHEPGGLPLPYPAIFRYCLRALRRCFQDTLRFHAGRPTKISSQVFGSCRALRFGRTGTPCSTAAATARRSCVVRGLRNIRSYIADHPKSISINCRARCS